MTRIAGKISGPGRKALAVLLGAVAAIAALSSPAHAAVPAETGFVFNTFSFLVHGFLVL